MKRICFVLQVKPDRLEEYKERHRAVWPEMLAALRETGWQNYSLFLRPDGMLVGYLETEDFERARAGMAKREINDRWQREMADFFVQPDGSLPDRAMEPLEEVFHLYSEAVLGHHCFFFFPYNCDGSMLRADLQSKPRARGLIPEIYIGVLDAVGNDHIHHRIF